MGLADFLQISENPAGDFLKRAARAYKRALKKGHKITWQRAIKAFKSGRLKADGSLSRPKKRKTSKKASRKKTARKTSRKRSRKTSKKKSSRKKTARKSSKKRSRKGTRRR